MTISNKNSPCETTVSSLKNTLPWDWTAPRIPLIVAPLFLVSGTALVMACLEAGAVGTFPALNGRTAEIFKKMLEDIVDFSNNHLKKTNRHLPPFGVNLIVHRSNPRWPEDLATCAQFKVPLVITSLGKPQEVVEVVHDYGGKVFADVTTVEHARKAAAAGVDGLILVCAGAGGHAGTLNPFVFTAAVKKFFHKDIVVAGGIHSGFCLKAIQALGAQWGYCGTPFLTAHESLASPAYKTMVTAATAADIVYTPAVSGTPANFMRQSLVAGGFEVERDSPPRRPLDMAGEAKAWRDVWSAGHSVELISKQESAAAIILRITQEYQGNNNSSS